MSNMNQTIFFIIFSFLIKGAISQEFTVGTSTTIADRNSMEAVQDLNCGYFDDSWRTDLPVVIIQPDGTASDGNTGFSSSASCQKIVDDKNNYPNGVRIKLAPGTHNWTKRVSLRSNISIEGAGSDSTIIECNFQKGTENRWMFRGQPFMMGAHHPGHHTIGRGLGSRYYGTPVRGLSKGSTTCTAVDEPVKQGTYTRNSDFTANPPKPGQLVMIADKSFSRDGGGDPGPATHNFPQWVKVIAVEGNTVTFDEPRVIDWARDGSGVMFWPTGSVDGSSGERNGIIENIRLEGFTLLKLQHFHRRGGCRNLLVKDVDASDIDPELLNKTYNAISANAIYRSTFIDCKFRGGIHSFEKKGASARSVLKNVTLYVEPMGSSIRPYASTGEGAYGIHYIDCTFEMPGVNDGKPSMIIRHEQFGGSFDSLIVNGNGYSCKASFFDMYLSGDDHPAGYTPFHVIFNGDMTVRHLFRLAGGNPPIAFNYLKNGNVTATSGDRNWEDPLPEANAGPDQFVTDTSGNGEEIIALDGSESFYHYGTIESYAWLLEGDTLAEGEKADVILPAGTHRIVLTLKDNKDQVVTDEVIINISGTGIPHKPEIMEFNDSLVSLNWDEKQGGAFREFSLYRGPHANIQQEDDFLVASGIHEGEYTDTGLTENTRYFYAVSATDTLGTETPLSDVVSVTTLHGKISRPRNFKASLNDEYSAYIEFSWVDGSDNEKGFAIYGKDIDSAEFNKIAEANEENISFFSYYAGGLSQYRHHVFYAVAFNDDTLSMPSNKDTLYIQPAPLKSPEGLKVDSSDDTRVYLSWNRINSDILDSYSIFRSDSSNVNASLENRIASGLLMNNYLDSGLVLGKTYYYTVTATDTTGKETPTGNVVSITITQDTALTIQPGKLNEFNVYPNPGLDFFYVNLPADDHYMASVYTMDGNVIKKSNSMKQSRILINLHGYPAGNYLLVISKKNNILYVNKIVKER